MRGETLPVSGRGTAAAGANGDETQCYRQVNEHVGEEAEKGEEALQNAVVKEIPKTATTLKEKELEKKASIEARAIQQHGGAKFHGDINKVTLDMVVNDDEGLGYWATRGMDRLANGTIGRAMSRQLEGPQFSELRDIARHFHPP